MTEDGKSGKVMAWINFGIFPGFVMLSVGRKYDEIMQVLKDAGEDAEMYYVGLSDAPEVFESGFNFARARSVVNDDDTNERWVYYIILTREFDFSDEAMGTLAHEVLHICQYYLPWVLDRNKEQEAEAYLHTHIFMTALDHLRKGTDILIEQKEEKPTAIPGIPEEQRKSEIADILKRTEELTITHK